MHLCRCDANHHHHHQPINAPTGWGTGLPYGLPTRRTSHNPPRGPSASWWVLMIANAAGTYGLTCLPKHGGARDIKFLVTHPMTDQNCLTSAIARRNALTAGHMPLLDIGPSYCSPSRSIFGYSHPSASRPAQIVTPPGLRASYTTFTETLSPLQNLFTPADVDYTAEIPIEEGYDNVK
jgi:hypothetical protein